MTEQVHGRLNLGASRAYLPLSSSVRSLVSTTLSFGVLAMAATSKFADHTLYHLSPKGFWKKFRELRSSKLQCQSRLPASSVQVMLSL